MRRIGTAAVLLVLGTAGCEAALAFSAGVSRLAPERLAEQLDDAEPPLVLDVRGIEAYRKGHVPGAVPVAAEQVGRYLAARGWPPDGTAVVVCRGGFRSVAGAVHAAGEGYRQVVSLAGGMERWEALGLPVRSGDEQPEVEPLPVPVRPLDTFGQLLVVFAGLTVKPAHMLLTLVLIGLLWRRRSPELRLARWGLVLLLAGETACALNYWLPARPGDPLEMLHDLGMVGGFALIPWGLFGFLEGRSTRFFDPEAHCAVQPLCGRCWKREAVPCAGRRLLWAGVVLSGALALVPLAMPLRPYARELPVFGSPVVFDFSLPTEIVLFRVFPLAALALFVGALVRALGGPASVAKSRAPYFLGFGFLSFALFRLGLQEAFRGQPEWSDFWEEAFEFLGVAGVGLFLWAFRHAVFGDARSPVTSGPTSDASAAGGAAPPAAATD